MDIRYVPLCKGNYSRVGNIDSRTSFRRLMMTLRLDGIDAKISRLGDHIELLVPEQDYYSSFVKAYDFVNTDNFVGFKGFIMPFDKDALDNYNANSHKNIVSPTNLEGSFAFREDKDKVAFCSSLYFASNGRLDTRWHFKKLRDMLRSNNIPAMVSSVKKHMEMIVPNKDYYKAFSLTFDYLQKARVFGFHAFVTPFNKEMVDKAKERQELPLIMPEQIRDNGIKIRKDGEEPQFIEKDEM